MVSKQDKLTEEKKQFSSGMHNVKIHLTSPHICLL